MFSQNTLREVIRAIQDHHSSVSAGHTGAFDLCPEEPCRSACNALTYEDKISLGTLAVTPPETSVR